jgi:hypothetical protein
MTVKIQETNGLKPAGRLDADTWARLTATSDDPVMVEYEVQEVDVKGPFNKSIPGVAREKGGAQESQLHESARAAFGEISHRPRPVDAAQSEGVAGNRRHEDHGAECRQEAAFDHLVDFRCLRWCSTCVIVGSTPAVDVQHGI